MITNPVSVCLSRWKRARTCQGIGIRVSGTVAAKIFAVCKSVQDTEALLRGITGCAEAGIALQHCRALCVPVPSLKAQPSTPVTPVPS